MYSRRELARLAFGATGLLIEEEHWRKAFCRASLLR